MIQIFTIISPLFLIILASALLRKLFRIGDDWERVLNEFAFRVGLPVLIFTVLSRTSFSFTEQLPLIIANSAFILFCFIIAVVIGKMLRLDRQWLLTLTVCFVFSNTAYLGIPVLSRVAGAEILPEVSLIIAIYLFWIFTVVIAFMDYSIDRDGKMVLNKMIGNLVKNPLLIALVLGFLVGGFGIQVPEVVGQALDMISASVTPTVLVVIGLFIGNSKLGKLSEWVSVVMFSLLTLIILPGIFYVGAVLFGFAPSSFFSSIIEAAMPLAITPFALADKYKLNKSFLAHSIVLSTMLSVVSLPFWITILQ